MSFRCTLAHNFGRSPILSKSRFRRFGAPPNNSTGDGSQKSPARLCPFWGSRKPLYSLNLLAIAYEHSRGDILFCVLPAGSTRCRLSARYVAGSKVRQEMMTTTLARPRRWANSPPHNDLARIVTLHFLRKCYAHLPHADIALGRRNRVPPRPETSAVSACPSNAKSFAAARGFGGACHSKHGY